MPMTMRIENMVENALADANEKTVRKAFKQARDVARYCGATPPPVRLVKLLAALLILSDGLGDDE